MAVALGARTEVAQIRATSPGREIFMDSSETETPSTQLAPTSAASTIETPVPQLSGSLVERLQKLALWQRFRSQPRETAAVVVLVVTAIIWLDLGPKQSDTSIPADPLDGYDSILSQFETSEDFDSLPVSSEPFDSTTRESFGRELLIPHSQRSDSMNTVTADYGDSSAAIRPNSSRPSAVPNGSKAGESRRVRFAGQIKPAN